MNEQYTFEIAPDLKKANKLIDDFSKRTQQQLDSISFKSGLSAFKDTVDLAGGAIRAVSGFFERANSEALEAEEATRSLNNAMRLSGEFSGAASKSALDFASSLAEVTVASDNEIVSSLALAKNYGLANSEAKRLVTVASDLAAVTGQDLNSATKSLAATYNGFISREMAKMLPELKNLTDAQLQAGGAVDLLAAKLKGSAADAFNSYGGDLAKARKEVEAFYEGVGAVSLRVTAFLIRDSIALKNNIVGLAKAIVRDSTIQTEDPNARANAIAASKAARDLDIKEYQAAQAAVKKRVADAAAAEAKTRLEAFRSGFVNERLQIELASLNDIERINREYLERENKVRKAFSLGLIRTKAEEQKLLEDLETQRLKKVERIQADQAKKVFETRQSIEGIVKSKLDEVSNAPLSGLIEFAVKGQEEIDKTKAKIDSAIQELIAGTDIAPAIKRQMIEAAEVFKVRVEKGFNTAVAAGLGSSIIKAVRRGAEGAADVIAKGVGAVASVYFGKEIGALVEEITSFLSQGADAVKKQINEFERAVPQVIQNIIEAIPAAFEAVIDNIPYVLEKSIEMIPRIFSAWLNFLPKLFNKIIEMLPKIVVSFVKAFVAAVPEMFKAFGQALYDSAVKFVEAILKAVTDVGGAIGSATGVGGNGGGSLLQTVLDPLGIFAEGGRVPDDQRFSGDRFPARLDAGEQVFSRDLTKRLENFLDGNAAPAGGQQVVVIKVGESEMARVLLNLNRGGFRTA